MSETEDSPGWQTRKLLRAARAATLATATDGQPFASLVTPACAEDLSVLVFLSQLSEHTRHLRADPRCAVMVTGAASSANPQTAPRVTITGMAEIEPDPALKARWLTIHPYAQLYAEFTDFALYRIRPLAGSLIGGFARAHKLCQVDLSPNPDAVAAISEAEPGILAHCNADHADAMALIAGGDGDWRMVTADVDGFDLAQGEIVKRIAWSRPVNNAAEIRNELVQRTVLARAGTK